VKSNHFLKIIVVLLGFGLIISGCAGNQKKIQGKAGPMDNPAHLTINGQKLLTAGDLDGARWHFERALSMDKNYVQAMVGMARVESTLGNMKNTFAWGKKALGKADSRGDRLLTKTAMMEFYLKYRQDSWLKSMESLWKELKKENEEPEAATLLLGKGYQAEALYLKASVCYRQVIDWQGESTDEADELLRKLFQQLRAEPGTTVGRTVASLEKISRGDVAALMIEEIKLPEYFKTQKTKKYEGGFKTPQEFSRKEKKAAMPTDIKGHPYEVDINAAIKLNMRGLEPFPDGRFHPAESMSRANFALVVEDILCRIKNEPQLKTAFVGNKSPFPDVSNDHYAFNAMLVCTTRNLLAADLDGAFRPDEFVTGAESLLAIRRLKEEIKNRQVTY